MHPLADSLERIQTIVVHDNCSDGLVSAIILNLALPSAKIIFAQYGATLANLPAEDNMLFCDFSPPRDRLEEYLSKENVWVLDHHKTVKDVVEAFGERGRFGDEVKDPGVSGAVLAYREVWLPLQEKHRQQDDLGAYPENLDKVLEEVATLAGVRDTWQKSSPRWEEAYRQHLLVMFYPKSFWMCGAHQLYHRVNHLNKEVNGDLGQILLDKSKEAIEKTVKGAYLFSAHGIRFGIVQTLHTTDSADFVDADVIVGWGYKVASADATRDWPQRSEAVPPQFILSCRSRSAIAVDGLAKSFGGGGHTKAAGFSMNADMADANPLARVRDILETYYATYSVKSP